MGIEQSADSKLWELVYRPYEERNFTVVILEAIQYLGDVVREKTGLSSDGMSLVGEAFGGAKPKLRVNRFETETDKNVQSGIEHLVRGLYKAFRNPRAHEKHVDNQEDADTVLMLVSYLLKVIGQAKSPFERASFLKRVFDPQFVKSSRYAGLLASEVPAKYRFDVLVEIFRSRATGSGDRLAYMVSALWELLSDELKVEFAAIVSEELNTLEKDEMIPIIRILPDAIWPICAEASRLRTETMIIESVSSGYYDENKKKLIGGALGTWAIKIMPDFILADELMNSVAGKLEEAYSPAFAYVETYLFRSIYVHCAKPTYRLLAVLREGLESGDIRFKKLLGFVASKQINDDFEETGEYRYPEWSKLLLSFYEKFVEVPKEESDDIPF